MIDRRPPGGMPMTTQRFGAADIAVAPTPTTPTGAERSLDEVKAEVLRRAGRLSPFEGIRRDEAEQIMQSLTSLDRDQWANAWCKVGLAHEARGDERATQGAGGKELAEIYTLAFEYCRIRRYP